MSILLFSSESRDLEKSIAQQTADQLGYKTLNQRFLADIAQNHSLELSKLNDALENMPSIFRRMSKQYWQYALSCVEMEVLNRLLENNVVCWGLSAHLYVLVVSHVLKVRLIGGYDARQEAVINKHVQQRDKWSQAAYKRNATDPKLYDLVINLNQIKPEEAISTLTATVEYPRFKPMTYSMNNLADRALAARVKNELLKSMTEIYVHAQNGTVVVTTTSLKREKNKKIAKIKETASQIKDIGYLEVHWRLDPINEAAMSSR